MVVFSGVYESHEPHPSGNVHSIIPPHCDGHKNGQQRVGTVGVVVLLIVPLAADGMIRSE
jgi:hypothetical protein